VITDLQQGADVLLGEDLLIRVQDGQSMTLDDIQSRDVSLSVDLLGHP